MSLKENSQGHLASQMLNQLQLIYSAETTLAVSRTNNQLQLIYSAETTLAVAEHKNLTCKVIL
jgi:hypothetical protein